MKSERPNPTRALFEFRSDPLPGDLKTGTFKDLLAEIAREESRQRSDGSQVDMARLQRARTFISEVTGERLDSLVQPLPHSTLATVKLLYRKDRRYKGHMFQLLQPPYISGKASLEFSTTGFSPSSPEAAKLVVELLAELAAGIEPWRVREIDRVLVPHAQFLDKIENENPAMLQAIYKQQAGNAEDLAKAFRRLATNVESFKPPEDLLVALSKELGLPIKRADPRLIPLQEKLYTYLRCLGYLHHVGEYQEVLKLSKINQPITPIPDHLDQFCEELSTELNKEVQRDFHSISLANFPKFASEHSKQLIGLVKQATGLDIRGDGFDRVVALSAKVLNMYLIHSHHYPNPEATLRYPILSVSDCVAALCTVRYQSKVKTEYEPYWFGQKQQPSNPLNALDLDRSIGDVYETDYIRHGVSQLMYNRFCAFHMALVGQIDRYDAWNELQLARLNKYSEIMRTYNIDKIEETFIDFRRHCNLSGAIASGWFEES